MFLAVQTKISGYKLFDSGNGIYKLMAPTGIYTGSLKQVSTFAVVKFGFDINEIEIGVLEMEKHFHNAAEYGIFKRFMWSYDAEEKDEKFSTRH